MGGGGQSIAEMCKNRYWITLILENSHGLLTADYGLD